MITKKDLALVADAVVRCGIAGGFSIDQILTFARQQAPSKDPAWLAALANAAKGKK